MMKTQFNLKRTLKLTLLASACLAVAAISIFVFACAFLAPSTQTVTSTVEIPLLPSETGRTHEFYESQIQLFNSPFVLSAALRGMERSEIRRLRANSLESSQDFIAWCDEHVACSLNQDETSIVFTLSSPTASKSQLSKLAKRIADAYREEAHCNQRAAGNEQTVVLAERIHP